jgi:hypothetical protein
VSVTLSLSRLFRSLSLSISLYLYPFCIICFMSVQVVAWHLCLHSIYYYVSCSLVRLFIVLSIHVHLSIAAHHLSVKLPTYISVCYHTFYGLALVKPGRFISHMYLYFFYFLFFYFFYFLFFSCNLSERWEETVNGG